VADKGSETQPPAIEEVVPDDFFEHEGEGELEDPKLMLESSQDMRSAWDDWHCKRGPGKFVDLRFFGRGVNGVPAPAQDAYKALEQALRATGYQPTSVGSFNCRHIGSDPNKPWSLHAYGVAIDIDPRENPFTPGDAYSGKFKKSHVDAALNIKNTAGRPVWEWGGNWRNSKDRMHFQLAQGPRDVTIDWSTVAGAEPVDLTGYTHRVTASSLNLRSSATTSADVLASLPNGTPVAADSGETANADGYDWLKIEAAMGGGVLQGWVAGSYLEPIETAGAPSGEVEQITATHRVDASGLNLRTRPALSGGMITELPDRTEVQAASGETRSADGYEWIKIRAASGGTIVEGWVAAQYLTPMG
jgi:uncharacterized protein YgiM (DUF1202 family)